MLAGCATVPSLETQNIQGGRITNHFGMGVSQAEIQRRADWQCQTHNADSRAVNLIETYKGCLMCFGEGGEYSFWDYKCESKSQQITKNKVELESMITKAKDTCKSLDFKEGTEKFSDCALKLYTQDVELAAKNNQQIVIQGQSSGSNTMTIYDPVRDSNALIKKGQRMISGACTLGIDC